MRVRVYIYMYMYIYIYIYIYMYIFIYICISISPSSHAGGRCHKINTHMHEWEYEDAATHAHILVECCDVESRHTQHHRRVHEGGETEAASRIAVLTLSAQAITPELPLLGLIVVTRLVQPALHAHQLL